MATITFRTGQTSKSCHSQVTQCIKDYLGRFWVSKIVSWYNDCYTRNNSTSM